MGTRSRSFDMKGKFLQGFGGAFKVIVVDGSASRSSHTPGQTLADAYSCMGSAFLLLALIGNLGMTAEPVTVFAAMPCGIALFVAVYCIRRKPSLYRLLPMGYGRKSVYFFLSAAIYSLLIGVFMILVLVVTTLLVALVTLAVSGEWIIVMENTAPAFVVSAQGEALALFITAAYLGTELLLSFIERRVLRNILIFLSPLALFLPLKLYARFAGISSGMLFVEFGKTAGGIAMLAAFGVAAAALAAAGVWRVVAYLRPRNY